MKWIEVTIKTTTEAVEAVTSILYECEVGGVVIEDPNDFLFQDKEDTAWDYIEENVFDTGYEGVIIKAYLNEQKNIVGEVEMIREKIKLLPTYGIEIGEGSVNITEVDEQDWANSWKQYYKPAKVGEKIVVKPTWEEYEKNEGEIVIELDPGMAFGTGTHETTTMCIRELEKRIKDKDVVFDIGCGSGILSIAAAKLGAQKTIGVDLDEVAVKVSKENVEFNNVDSSVEIRYGNLMNVVTEKANIVVANIIADIIAILAKDVSNFLNDDGLFISSGIILDKIEFVKAALLENNFEILEVNTMGEWAAIVSKKGE
ncbi:MAG: 50S ribosomal protein L11 methyltransferase [Tepidibacter sp.]|jgi:ribosomal protein L11 methyltransferase|uniref:50S ribosomal protein L11 methyltransferase n=1 Tax=Tepidibacter sp. TaxID=2529387 RepID=UPI0025E773F9|nr:50S ribosomal protein L11 methyltransferase [Tepidibacter sp.]MCT4507575.1 50S ribosomal protein L11 methyltransferase [Tepidibacter sp.]